LFFFLSVPGGNSLRSYSDSCIYLLVPPSPQPRCTAARVYVLQKLFPPFSSPLPSPFFSPNPRAKRAFFPPRAPARSDGAGVLPIQKIEAVLETPPLLFPPPSFFTGPSSTGFQCDWFWRCLSWRPIRKINALFFFFFLSPFAPFDWAFRQRRQENTFFPLVNASGDERFAPLFFFLPCCKDAEAGRTFLAEDI